MLPTNTQMVRTTVNRVSTYAATGTAIPRGLPILCMSTSGFTTKALHDGKVMGLTQTATSIFKMRGMTVKPAMAVANPTKENVSTPQKRVFS